MAVWAAMAERQMTLRIALVTAGLAAIAWALTTMPSFWLERDIRSMALHIVGGESYKPEVMEAADGYISRDLNSLRPSALEDVAIFRLRQAETALASGNERSADAAIATLGQAVDRALQNSPTASFLWLMRYWTENRLNGFNPDNLRDLQESYALGRNEAWIAEKRNRQALAVFDHLPDELAHSAVTEFVGLVDSGQFAVATDILTGPGAPMRQVLLSALGGLSHSVRRRFAEVLYTRQPDGYIVPGIEPTPPQPWTR